VGVYASDSPETFKIGYVFGSIVIFVMIIVVITFDGDP